MKVFEDEELESLRASYNSNGSRDDERRHNNSNSKIIRNRNKAATVNLKSNNGGKFSYVSSSQGNIKLTLHNDSNNFKEGSDIAAAG